MYDWKPYVPVAERRRRAAAAMKRHAAQGHPVDPVVIDGRTIATTPWGKAWCQNLEAYSDFANRLPRGRTYARNGSVVDLQLEPGRIRAFIAGSELYRATISVNRIPRKRWRSMCAACAGGIDSLVALLRGRLDQAVMQRLCKQGDGLFPTPKQFTFDCDCPDWAGMCKHIAAVLYGVGNRLDRQPELLFTLRGVDPAELIDSAGADLAQAGSGVASDRILDDGSDLGALFGLDLDGGDDQVATTDAPAPSRRGARRSKTASATKRARGKTAEAAAPRSPDRSVPTTPPPRGRGLYATLYRRLAKAGSLTSAEAQVACKASAAELRPLFKRLVAEGHATVSGKTRGTTYHLDRG